MADISTPSQAESLPMFSPLRSALLSVTGSDTLPENALEASLISVAVITLVTGIFLYRASRNAKLPSAFFGVPVLGNMIEYPSNPIQYLKNAVAKYGQFFQVNMLCTNTIWLMGTEMNKLYLSEKEETWSFGGGMVRIRDLIQLLRR